MHGRLRYAAGMAWVRRFIAGGVTLWLSGAMACDGCDRGHGAPPPAADDSKTEVELRASGVLLGTSQVASRADLAGIPKRVQPLTEAIDARRDAWRTAHPRQTMPETATLTVPTDATCTEVAALMITLAYAAHRHITLHQGSETLDVDWYIPEVPLFDLPDPDPPLPVQTRFLGGGRAAVGRTCKGAKTNVETSALPAAVAATRPHAPALYFGCEPGVSFAEVRPALAALRAAEKLPLDDDACGALAVGSSPPQVIVPNLGLAGLGVKDTFDTLPGTLGETKITATGVEVDAVRTAIAPHLVNVANCFAKKREARPMVSLGNLDGDHRIVTLVVAPDGGIGRAQKGRTADAVELCIALDLVSLTFPPLDGGAGKIVLDFVYKDDRKPPP